MEDQIKGSLDDIFFLVRKINDDLDEVKREISEIKKEQTTTSKAIQHIEYKLL